MPRNAFGTEVILAQTRMLGYTVYFALVGMSLAIFLEHVAQQMGKDYAQLEGYLPILEVNMLSTVEELKKPDGRRAGTLANSTSLSENDIEGGGYIR